VAQKHWFLCVSPIYKTYKKTWAVLREGLGWLAGVLNTALSYNKGYSVHVLMLILGLLLYVWDVTNINEVLSKRSWPGRSNWGQAFFNKQGRPKGASFGYYLDNLEIYCSRDGSGSVLECLVPCWVISLC
jgi:hypothetical protein